MAPLKVITVLVAILASMALARPQGDIIIPVDADVPINVNLWGLDGGDIGEPMELVSRWSSTAMYVFYKDVSVVNFQMKN